MDYQKIENDVRKYIGADIGSMAALSVTANSIFNKSLIEWQTQNPNDIDIPTLWYEILEKSQKQFAYWFLEQMEDSRHRLDLRNHKDNNLNCFTYIFNKAIDDFIFHFDAKESIGFIMEEIYYEWRAENLCYLGLEERPKCHCDTSMRKS